MNRHCFGPSPAFVITIRLMVFSGCGFTHSVLYTRMIGNCLFAPVQATVVVANESSVSPSALRVRISFARTGALGV